MIKKDWNLQNTFEGKALILGPGFDFDGMLILDEESKSLVIRLCFRQAGNYPEIVEETISLESLEKLLNTNENNMRTT